MKVLHVIPSISSKLGGPTQVILNLVRALQDEGISAEIATTNDDIEEVIPDIPLHQRIEHEGVPVWFFPRSARMKEFLPSLSFTGWLWKNIQNYDILDNHYLFSYLPTCAAMIAQWQNVPYTVRTMGQLSPWALAQSKRKKQVYSSLIERRNLAFAAAVHCTSAGEAEDNIQFGVKPPKIVLPLGVNPPAKIPDAKYLLRDRYNISEQTPIVLFLSRLHYKKRPELLIQTLSRLASEQQKFHLIIAGSGEAAYVESLQQMVVSLNLTEQTSFVGFVAGYDKDLLLQGSDIFVLPTYSENFGIALAEAMVSGLSIITTPGTQIAPEIAQAKAGIIVEGEIEPLQAAIAHLLNSPLSRQELGENGRLYALQRYSWQAIAQKLASTYQIILSQEPLPEYVTPMSL
ncbi:group 1 glycosyl transferase [Nostoc sp. NIES-3756]|uniref:glycosyltransferase n=1 Tax=Nostoc sp. NIES-3756 TaxID=1751286 RepID=UPI0007207F48|nr:glycosyltransferase [Nostoc sp. NIES-3756]BAT55531.1 group 1 glycosyl transferase [Nostoc sp. NIES-3756]